LLPTWNPSAIVWTLSESTYQTPTSVVEAGPYNRASGDIHAIQAWIERELDLSTIGKFQNNWDGFDATAPDPVVVSNAISFLRTLRERQPANPPIRAVISPDGLIAFEWLEGNNFIRAEIENSTEVEWMIAGPDRPTEFEVEYLEAPTAGEVRNQTWQPAPSAVGDFVSTY
jgi:hypothetical protein